MLPSSALLQRRRTRLTAPTRGFVTLLRWHIFWPATPGTGSLLHLGYLGRLRASDTPNGWRQSGTIPTSKTACDAYWRKSAQVSNG